MIFARPVLANPELYFVKKGPERLQLKPGLKVSHKKFQ